MKGVDFWIGPAKCWVWWGSRLGQDHDRPRDGRTHLGRRRIAQGARHRDERRKPRTPGQTRPDIGFVFRTRRRASTAPYDRGVHRRAADRAQARLGARAARQRVNELLDAVQLPDRVRRPVPARAVGRSASARLARARPRARPEAAHRRRADLCARRVGAGACAAAVRAAAAEFGFACLFISHDLAVVDEVADRVVVLQQGVIREQGTTVQVLTEPRDDYTKRLLCRCPCPTRRAGGAPRACGAPPAESDG